MGLESLTQEHKTALLRFVLDHGKLFLEAEQSPAHLEYRLGTSQEADLKVILQELIQLAQALDS